MQLIGFGLLLFIISPILGIIYIIKKKNYGVLLLVFLVLGYQSIIFNKLHPPDVNANVKIKVLSNLKHNKFQTTFIGLINNQPYLISCNLNKKIDYNHIINAKITQVNKITSKYHNFSSFNTTKYYASKKIFYNIKINNIKLTLQPNIISTLKNFRWQLLNTHKDAIIANALILGEKAFDPNIIDLLSTTGVIHLFTISGMHVVFLITLIKKITTSLKFNTLIADVISYLFTFIFFFIGGYNIPVFRACIMFLLKKFINKPPHVILNIITLVIILLNPFIIYNASFLLSFSICYVILLANNLRSFQLNFLLFLFPLLITINFNYQLNLLTPLINLIAIPFVTMVLLPLSLLYILLPLSFLTKIISGLFTIFIYFLKIMLMFNITVGHFSFYKIQILGLIIYYFYKYKKYLITLLMIIIISLPLKSFWLSEITFIDVNQGDSILITSKYFSKTILIDTGNTFCEQEIIKFLRAKNITKIDYLIISHFDKDHCGNTLALTKNFIITHILSSDFDPDEQINYQLITTPQTLNCYGFKLDLIPPLKRYEDRNNNSLVVILTHPLFNIMFTGDIELEREAELVSYLPSQSFSLIKAAHHGSKTSSSLAFLKHFPTKHIIISVGLNNRYHHPNPEVIKRYQTLHINYYLTSQLGQITFYF